MMNDELKPYGLLLLTVCCLLIARRYAPRLGRLVSISGAGGNYAGSARAMSVASTHGVNEPTVLEEREGGRCQLRFMNDE